MNVEGSWGTDIARFNPPEESFVSVRHVIGPDDLAEYQRERGRVEYEYNWQGETCVFKWSWTGGAVTLVTEPTLLQLKAFYELNLLPWEITVVGYRHEKCGWYVRKGALRDRPAA